MTDDKKTSNDIELLKPNANMSPLAAWREERRLASVAKVHQKYNEVLERAQDTNIGIGNLARSEIFKEEALSELTELPTYLDKKRQQRELESDVELMKLQKEHAILKKELDEINGVVPQEVVTEDNVIDVEPDLDNVDKHSGIAQEAEKEIAELKVQADNLRKKAREEGDYSDAFEKALQKDLEEQIESIRNQAYNKSHNV